MGGKVAPWAPRWIPCLLALFIGLLIVDGGFVYDDGPSIVANPTMQPDQPFSAVFTTDIWGSPLDEIVRGYRPLTNLFWKVLWSITPENPQIFRFFTILFHVLATLAVTRIVQAISPNLWVVGAAGFLFAVHPIHVETLGGITWQSDILSAACGLWALFLTIKPRTRRHFVLIPLLLSMSILSKESGFIYGLAICAYLLSSERKGVKTWGLFTLSSLLVATAVGFQLSLDRGDGALGSNNILFGAGLWERMLLGFSIVGKGTLMLLIPHRLSPSHGYAEVDLSLDSCLPLALAGITFFGIALWVGIRSILKHKNWVSCGVVLWMGPILLMSGLIIPVQTDFAERLLYTSSVPAVILAAWAMGRIPGSLKTTVVCFLLLLSLVIQYPAIRAWKSNDTLWERAEQVRPQAIRTQENFGLVQLGRGELYEGSWHMLVGTYLRLSFPKPVDWDRVEAINQRYEGKEKILTGPALLSFPHSPCPLIEAYAKRMDVYVPGFSKVAGKELLARYPACIAETRQGIQVP